MGVGDNSTPVYIDDQGVARPCTDLKTGGGSGGVINGDRIELSTPGQNGGTLSDNNKRWELSTALNMSTSKTIYTVENDSVVYVHVYEGNNAAIDAGMLLYAGDAVIAYVDNAKDNGGFGMTHCFPLKKGTVLSAQLDGATVDDITYRFRIQEFKFYAMAPQIAMPDYDKMTTLFNNRVSPSVNLFDGTTHEYTIPENGYVRVYVAASNLLAHPILNLYVNDTKSLFNLSQADGSDCDHNFMAPVSKDDVLKLNITTGEVEIYFFPAKAVQATVDYSGVDGSGGAVPDYSKYDNTKHDVTASDITTYGNQTDNTTGYTKTINRSTIGTKFFTATEDCFFFPLAYAYVHDSDPAEAYPLAVYVGENATCDKLFRVFMQDNTHLELGSAWSVPLKKGQILAIWNGGYAENYAHDTDTESGKCFWLPVQGFGSASVVMPVPDWDPDKDAAISSGDVIQSDGWIVIEFDEAGLNDYKSTVKINGIAVYVGCGGGAGGQPTYATTTVPVSKGDSVTFVGDNTSNLTVTFYPVKMHAATSDTAHLPDLYTVGSDGVLRNHAVNQVTLNGNTTLKLPAAVTGKVRDFVVDVEVSTAGTITWQNSDGTSFTTYKYDKARGSNPLTDTLTAGSTYQFYFTERRTGGSFRVELSELESPT